MPLDGAVLGNLAAEQMAALEAAYGDDEDVQIGAAITIVEVLRQEGTDPTGNPNFSSNVRLRFNLGDPYRALGLLDQAKYNLLASSGISPTPE